MWHHVSFWPRKQCVMILQWLRTSCGVQIQKVMRGIFPAKDKTYIGNQSSCSLWYSIAVWPSTSSTRLPYWKLQSHLTERKKNMDKFKEKNNAQLWSKFIKRRKKELLKTCSIHAHNKLKYSLTGGFNHTNSLHCSATASCLWIAHKHQATWEYGLDLNYLYIAISINNLQGNQHLGAPQKCGGLKKSTPHQKSNPVTQQRNRVTSKTEVLAILASDKAPVSSRENLLRASLIWYSQIIFTGPVI